MVDDTENQVRRLLDYCGLPFDERCLQLCENDRAVRTASSSRCAVPSIATASINGSTANPGSTPCKRAGAGARVVSGSSGDAWLTRSLMIDQRSRVELRGYNMGERDG